MPMRGSMRHLRRLCAWVPVVWCLCLLPVAGCGTEHYRTDADEEVYRIIAHKQNAVLGTETPFTIEQQPSDPLDGLPRRFQPLIPESSLSSEMTPGGSRTDTEPPAIISLTQAMAIAVANSRDYQRRKEDVYLAALDLSLARHRWSPRFSALLSGKWKRADKDESWAGDADFGVTQLLASGATFTLGLSTEFLHYMTGSPRAKSASALTASLVQPLWRGAGKRIAQESLTQAERDVIYEIRSFARYHRTFAVSIVSSYFRILRQRDAVRNEWSNFERLSLARERAEALAQAGRMPEFQVDQARQDELRAKDRWIRSEQTYKELLDQFKINLGLTTDADVDVDTADLERLTQAGIIHPELEVENAVRQALALRLDLVNADDRVADAERRVEVAADGLGGDIDLVLSSSAETEDDTKPTRFRFDRGTYSFGLDADLPLDRKAERNTYRKSLISLERARRASELLRDNIKQQVRQAWRSLQEAKESYEIQRNSLALAERRVESTSLLLQAGRASTRDLLESQSALLEAQNALTRVLVDHTIARLELWRDIGTLVVTPDNELSEEESLEEGSSSQTQE